MAEWSKAADCKSVRLISRWFESNLSQMDYLVTMKSTYFLKKFEKVDSFKIKSGIQDVSTVVSTAKVTITAWLFFQLNWYYKLLNYWYLLPLVINNDNETDKNKSIFKLDFNFNRNRFFPQLRTSWSKSQTIFNLSLGVLAKKFSSKKKFIRSKSSYILAASYLRRFLVTISSIRIHINVVGLPIYLVEILKTILNQTNALYKDPYDSSRVVNEKADNMPLGVGYLKFIRNKSFTPLKRKKVGRLKRKISKRIKTINNLLD